MTDTLDAKPIFYQQHPLGQRFHEALQYLPALSEADEGDIVALQAEIFHRGGSKFLIQPSFLTRRSSEPTDLLSMNPTEALQHPACAAPLRSPLAAYARLLENSLDGLPLPETFDASFQHSSDTTTRWLILVKNAILIIDESIYITDVDPETVLGNSLIALQAPASNHAEIANLPETQAIHTLFSSLAFADFPPEKVLQIKPFRAPRS